MGLDMKTRRKICGVIFKRYQKAGKKGKTQILDEYSVTLGLNRDYLANTVNKLGQNTVCPFKWETGQIYSQIAC